jgi:hypothetical protein
MLIGGLLHAWLGIGSGFEFLLRTVPIGFIPCPDRAVIVSLVAVAVPKAVIIG